MADGEKKEEKVTVDVSVDFNEELRRDAEFGKDMLNKLRDQCVKHDVPYNFESQEAIRDTFELLKEAKKLHEIENQDYDEVRGGSGTVPLSGAEHRTSDEFDSYEDMIDALRDQENFGNPEEKKEATAILNEFFNNMGKAHQDTRAVISYDTQKENRSVLADLKRKWKKDKLKKMHIDKKDLPEGDN